jgi:hypothetical protein
VFLGSAKEGIKAACAKGKAIGRPKDSLSKSMLDGKGSGHNIHCQDYESVSDSTSSFYQDEKVSLRNLSVFITSRFTILSNMSVYRRSIPPAAQFFHEETRW